MESNTFVCTAKYVINLVMYILGQTTNGDVAIIVSPVAMRLYVYSISSESSVSTSLCSFLRRRGYTALIRVDGGNVAKI